MISRVSPKKYRPSGVHAYDDGNTEEGCFGDKGKEREVPGRSRSPAQEDAKTKSQTIQQVSQQVPSIELQRKQDRLEAKAQLASIIKELRTGQIHAYMATQKCIDAETRRMQAHAVIDRQIDVLNWDRRIYSEQKASVELKLLHMQQGRNSNDLEREMLEEELGNINSKIGIFDFRVQQLNKNHTTVDEETDCEKLQIRKNFILSGTTSLDTLPDDVRELLTIDDLCGTHTLAPLGPAGSARKLPAKEHLPTLVQSDVNGKITEGKDDHNLAGNMPAQNKLDQMMTSLAEMREEDWNNI